MNTNMKHILITLFLIVTMTSQSWSQYWWKKTYGGSSGESGYSITTTSDGGVLVTGETSSNDGDFKGRAKGGSDIFVVKLDSRGNVQWKKTYGGSDNEVGQSITNTPDKGIVLTGWTVSGDVDFKGLNKGKEDIFVMKLDSVGDVQWKKTLGGSDNDRGVSISPTLHSGLVLVGWSDSEDGDLEGMKKSFSDILVVKLDSNGDVQWKKTIGGSDNDRGLSISATLDSGLVLTGFTSSNDGDFEDMNKLVSDIFVIKLDSLGVIQWRKTFGGSGSDWGYSITTTSDLGVLITGYTESNDVDFKGMNKGEKDIFVIKLDSLGDVQWKRTYGGTGGDEGWSITTTPDGGIIISGYTRSNNGDFDGMHKGQYDIFVMKLDSLGDVQWKRTYGGTGNDWGHSIATTSDGGPILTGYSSSNDFDFNGIGKGGSDIFVITLDSNGNLNPSTSVTDYTSITPSLLVTPNPISTSSTVVFSTGTPTTVRIELLNTLGESVSVLHDGFMESGEHRVSLGVSSVSSGLYYVRMTSEGTVNSTQVVVLK